MQILVFLTQLEEDTLLLYQHLIGFFWTHYILILPRFAVIYFTLGTIIIEISTRIKIFRHTFQGAQISFNLSRLGSFQVLREFIFLFTIGTRVILAYF